MHQIPCDMEDLLLCIFLALLCTVYTDEHLFCYSLMKQELQEGNTQKVVFIFG